MSVLKPMSQKSALVKLAAIAGSLFVITGIVLGMVISQLGAASGAGRPARPAIERPNSAPPSGSCAICQARYDGGGPFYPAENHERKALTAGYPPQAFSPALRRAASSAASRGKHPQFPELKLS